MTARLRGALLSRDRPYHFGPLSPNVYVMGVGKSVTCWWEMTPPPHESPTPMDQLGMVFTQQHKAKVFLEVDGQGGKNSLSHLYWQRRAILLSWNSDVVNIYNLEKDELRQTYLPNTHHGDYTECGLNTLQNTLKKQTKEAMGCCCCCIVVLRPR